MEKELIYIFGKHAVYEALVHRPDVVRELYIEHGFQDDKIFARIGAVRTAPRILNPKRLPGGLRNDAVHQGIIAGIYVNDLVLEYKDTVYLKGDNLDRFFLMKFLYEIDRDTIVSAIEFVPGNSKAVHHVNGHIIQYN